MGNGGSTRQPSSEHPTSMPTQAATQGHRQRYDCHALVDLDGISCSDYDDESASAGEAFLEGLLTELTLDSNDFSSVHASCADDTSGSMRRRLDVVSSVQLGLGLGINATTTSAVSQDDFFADLNARANTSVSSRHASGLLRSHAARAGSSRGLALLANATVTSILIVAHAPSPAPTIATTSEPAAKAAGMEFTLITLLVLSTLLVVMAVFMAFVHKPAAIVGKPIEIPPLPADEFKELFEPEDELDRLKREAVATRHFLHSIKQLDGFTKDEIIQLLLLDVSLGYDEEESLSFEAACTAAGIAGCDPAGLPGCVPVELSC